MSAAQSYRVRIQLHLSTALLLMIACGVLYWLNLKGRFTAREIVLPASMARHYDAMDYGWPQPAVTILHTPAQSKPLPHQSPMIDVCGIVFDVGTVIFFLSIIYGFAEWRIRLQDAATWQRARLGNSQQTTQ